MEPRKKPTPAPLARSTQLRPLIAATFSSTLRSLPTVAALLAATGALACQQESHIEPDQVVAVVKFVPSAPSASTATAPTPPAPGMGALELAVEMPPPPPPKIRPPPPPMKHPPIVKGAMKHVVPTPKAPKLGGDVAAVDPTI